MYIVINQFDAKEKGLSLEEAYVYSLFVNYQEKEFFPTRIADELPLIDSAGRIREILRMLGLKNLILGETNAFRVPYFRLNKDAL